MITPRYQRPEVDPHVAWTKVKTSAMRRPYLDCGCRNDGRDTFLHLGCARIACKTHADDPHECQHYEPESPPREGSPEVSEAFAALRSADRVTGEQVRQIDQALGRPDWAEVDEVLRNTAYPRGACCDLHGSNCEQGGEECCDDCTERLHFADNHGGLECSAPVLAPRADVRVMTPEEAAGFDAQQRLSLECSRSRPMCSGCDGGGMDGFTCMHECHNEPVTFAVDVSRSGEAAVAIRGASGHMWILDEVQQFVGGERFERVEAESDAPPVDAASDRSQDRPQRRTAADPDLGRSTGVDPVPPRRPWWRIW